MTRCGDLQAATAAGPHFCVDTATPSRPQFPGALGLSGATAECVVGLFSDIRIPNTYWGGVNRTPSVTQIAGCVTCVSPTHMWGGLHTAARRADNRKQMKTFLPTDSQPASPGVCCIITFVPERELEA